MKSVQTLFFAFLCVALSSYKVAADVPNPGFNSLFIGHSFFRPFAEGMPDYAATVGIAGHSQLVVFSGGTTGAPLALWNNPTKSAEIKAYLDSGDVELFGMTTAANPTTEGYENWIDYALAKNPNTRFALALPWLDFPENYDAATYANGWNLFHTTAWHDFVDEIRALYPGVDIYCIPYGQSSGELYVRFDVNNLPDVQNLVGAAVTSIYSDAKGHAGHILRDTGQLVWLNAIYDVDLFAHTVGPGYITNLKAIAQTTIMEGHDPAYDAAYHVDGDGDRVGDSLDNCPGTANPDQINTDGDTEGDVCDEDDDNDTWQDFYDNCRLVANFAQRDTDGDGFGNYCDSDLNNDNFVNSLDLGLFKSRFFTADRDADLNGDGFVNSLDLGLFKQMFFLPPGP